MPDEFLSVVGHGGKDRHARVFRAQSARRPFIGTNPNRFNLFTWFYRAFVLQLPTEREMQAKRIRNWAQDAKCRMRHCQEPAAYAARLTAARN